MAPKTPKTESQFRREFEDADRHRYETSSTKLALMAQDLAYVKDKIDDLADRSVSPDKFQNLLSRVSLMEKVV